LTVIAFKIPVGISLKGANQVPDRMIQLNPVKGYKLAGKERLISPLIKEYLEENQLWSNFSQRDGFEKIN
jgi:hypothetical protein